MTRELCFIQSGSLPTNIVAFDYILYIHWQAIALCCLLLFFLTKHLYLQAREREREREKERERKRIDLALLALSFSLSLFHTFTYPLSLSFSSHSSYQTHSQSHQSYPPPRQSAL